MKRIILLAIAAFITLGSEATEPGNDMYGQFLNPDRSYRPRVWWHWMNGNITKDGIRKDIEWMDRAGIVGFHNFDAGLSTPQIVDDRLIYMTPEWKDAFNYALDIADSLDMEVTIASSPGWSITGGPWVTKDDAEKKVVWSDMIVHGGQVFEDYLPEPIICSGPYQDICGYPAEPNKFEYYKDLFVLAVRLTDEEASAMDRKHTFSTSDSKYFGLMLNDHDLNKSDTIRAGRTGYAWVEYEFMKPETMRSLLFVETTGTPVCLEVIKDEQAGYETLVEDLPLSQGTVTTIREFDIPEVTAYAYRIRAKEKGASLKVAEASFSPVTKVNMGQDKAGFFATYTVSDNYPTPEVKQAPKLGDVIDITDKCKDGVLKWKAPKGTWRVIRFGWNLQGRRNSPASPEATGLEVDKLDGDAVRRYYDNYLGMYQEASGGRLGEAINCLMIDSYESGKGNWMINMEKEFKSRRGYELRPWMPVLTGQIINSSRESEQFLFDWRMTLGELIAENHYDIVNDILSKYGMTRHTEAHEERTAFVGDGMMVKRHADIPMSAIWARFNAGWHSSYPTAEADIRESSSVAHIYGQNICAAESFTVNGKMGKWDGFGAYQCAPYNLKPLADAAMANGLNRFIIHTSVHQPCDDKVPGLALGPYGQYFNRHDTWAEEAKSWTDYLSRSCYLLQQGKWVADIAYFYGEDKNITALFFDKRVIIPQGYNFDFVNADIMLHEFKIGKGCLVTDSGMSYKILVIDKDLKYMSLPVLKRIYRSVKAGLAVYGPKPQFKADLKGSERQFRRIADKIWDSGKYNILSGTNLAFALSESEFVKDADLNRAGSEDVKFVHRRLDDGDLYWVANISEHAREFTASFNVTGKKPEIWHADSGVRETPSYHIWDGRTYVDLKMLRDDAQFIFFVENTEESGYEAPQASESICSTVSGAWDVAFEDGRGAPARISMPVLKPLDESSIEGVKYFSGTATYSKKFHFGAVPEGRMIIDLGEVHHMARVFLNGEDLGLAWKAPYRIDATGHLREGENLVEIKVINSWANRLIGDQKKKEADRITYTAWQFYDGSEALVPSGFVGPVRIICQK